MKRPGVQRSIELLALVVASATGLAWALPAAGIGLTLGFCLVLQGIDARLFSWFVRGRGRPADDDPPADGVSTPSLIHALWIVLLVAGCGIVAYLGERDVLGHGYEFIPAIVPFLLVAFAVPGVVRGGPARAT